MTMIAFAVYGDHAEFITDSVSYAPGCSTLDRCTKFMNLPHLDMAVMCQGDSHFNEDAKLATMQVSNQLPTFDQVVHDMPSHLRELWARRVDDFPGASPSIVFLIGYSTERKRFTAWSLAADRDDFEPLEMHAPYVMPIPRTLRPDRLQAQRFRQWERQSAADRGEEPEGHKILAVWMQRPELTAPASTEEWVDLARLVREQRAETDYAGVIVHGDVFHTRLARGEVHTRRIHTFDETGDGFLRMIEGTQHPQAQLMLCYCGSGQVFLDCHLAPDLDKPCKCGRWGTPKTFRECCALTAEMREALEEVRPGTASTS